MLLGLCARSHPPCRLGPKPVVSLAGCHPTRMSCGHVSMPGRPHVAPRLPPGRPQAMPHAARSLCLFCY